MADAVNGLSTGRFFDAAQPNDRFACYEDSVSLIPISINDNVVAACFLTAWI